MRGEPIVQAVLQATLAELMATGYRALRIEDVATRAGVNKTTIYRRWPTKAELAREAIGTIADRFPPLPDTGALRTDLLGLVHFGLQTMRNLEGEGIIRLLMEETEDEELSAIAESIRRRKEESLADVIRRAMERGELPDDVDPGTLHFEVFVRRCDPSQEFAERLVDFVIAGARHSGEGRAPQKKAPRRPSQR